jgi:hypothetical protein
MTRDNIERLALYARTKNEVRRIALNMEQARRYSPPPSFVKEGDTRTTGYRERFGTEECWELDALSPTVPSPTPERTSRSRHLLPHPSSSGYDATASRAGESSNETPRISRARRNRSRLVAYSPSAIASDS